MLQPFTTPRTLQIYLRRTIFCSPVWKWSIRTPLCGCCWNPRSRTWWIKEGPKRGVFGRFSERKCTTAQKPVCMQMELTLNWKKYVFLVCLRVLKKSVLKLLDRTVYVHLYNVHVCRLCCMMKLVLYWNKLYWKVKFIFTNNYLPINEAKYLHIFLQTTSTFMFINLLHNRKSFSH